MSNQAVDPRVLMRLGIAAAANALAIVEEADVLADVGHDERAFPSRYLPPRSWPRHGLRWSHATGPVTLIGAELRRIVRSHHREKLEASLFLERDFPNWQESRPDAMARELAEC
jgi:hypothetical protein